VLERNPEWYHNCIRPARPSSHDVFYENRSEEEPLYLRGGVWIETGGHLACQARAPECERLWCLTGLIRAAKEPPVQENDTLPSVRDLRYYPEARLRPCTPCADIQRNTGLGGLSLTVVFWRPRAQPLHRISFFDRQSSFRTCNRAVTADALLLPKPLLELVNTSPGCTGVHSRSRLYTGDCAENGVPERT
jgi:hypothetical protein